MDNRALPGQWLLGAPGRDEATARRPLSHQKLKLLMLDELNTVGGPSRTVWSAPTV
jgi:hypothetical protein